MSAALPIRQWLIASIERIERDQPPSPERDRALAALRGQLGHHNAKLDLMGRFAAPNSMSDWLDRRCGLLFEAERLAKLQYALLWIDQHHPRYNGRG